MSQELKPSPFCGNKEVSFERLGTSRQSCIVECGNCGCRHESSDEYEMSGRSWNERAELESASQPGSVDSPEYERGYADGKRDTRFVMLSEGFRKPETGSQPGSGEAVTESMMIAGARSLIDGQENRPGSSWADEAKWCFEAMTLAAPSAGNGEAMGGRDDEA